MFNTPQPIPTARPGFNLIELLVTIAIIALLVGISLPVALNLRGSAKTQTAQGMLNGLAAAADEYNIVTQSKVDHTANTDAFGNPINLNVATPNDATLGYFVFTAGQVPTTAKLIAIAVKQNMTLNDVPLNNINDAIANGQLTSGNYGQIVLEDPWESQIRYAGSVSHTDAFTADDYLPAHPTAFFASAGPDGQWGAVDNNNQPDPTVDLDGDGVADAADNIYSFEID